jgi:NAD(P)H-hydrate epimerase
VKVVTRKQMAEIEKKTNEHIGISEMLLMENAAMAVARHCLEYMADKPGCKVIIITGTGRNGGDGLAVARHLWMRGLDVGIIFVGEKERMAPQTAEHIEIARNLEIPIVEIPQGDSMLDIPYTLETCELVVDALFGTGVRASISGIHEYIIEMVNTCAKHVISIDIPSGVNPDNGSVTGLAIRAAKTVTFAHPKLGLYLYPGTEYAGEIVIENISIPPYFIHELDVQTEILTAGEVGALLPKRPARSNKGTFGKTYIFAGSNDMPGTAVLASSAVYKAGGGLVHAFAPALVTAAINSAVPEAITTILPDTDGYLCADSLAAVSGLENARVVILGPGLGRKEGVKGFVTALFSSLTMPVILDADALNVIADTPEILLTLKAPSVVTPHPGELSRLTGVSIIDILGDPILAALEFAKKYNVVTVLKDARTVVAGPNGAVYINLTGTSAMSKAGMGDALTGLIAAFISQGQEAYLACILATYAHGKAGELAAGKLSGYGVTATDVIQNVPLVLNEIV